jgi:hypothetical protein
MSDRIYVDIDDVLSRTIERLIDLLEEMHARRVEVEEVRHFDLEKSFSLDGAEIQAFMDRAHSDAEIEAIAPAAGAAEVLAGWAESGHSISLVTGRPPITNEASRRWSVTRSRTTRFIISTNGDAPPGTRTVCPRSASTISPRSASDLRWKTASIRRCDWSKSSTCRWH